MSGWPICVGLIFYFYGRGCPPVNMVTTYPIIRPAIPSAGVYFFTTTEGVQYEVRFGRKQDDILSVSIVFGVLNDEYDGEEYVITNKGDVFSVMKTVSEVVRMYIKEHPNVRSYEFTGEPSAGESLEKPTKRIKLYGRYVKRIFPVSNWSFDFRGNTIVVTRK